jgi:glycosyltransferase involved in cell wall biosynthesis
MKRVGIVQPVLARYRLPVYLELSRYCRIDLFFSPARPELGYGSFIPTGTPDIRYFEVPTLRPFGDKIGMLQRGLVDYILREKPDAVVIFASPRYLSFWTTLLWARLCSVRVYAHGHGLCKKSRVGVFYRLMTDLMLRLVTSYIAYAPSVRASFVAHGFSDKKVHVADNSMTISFTVRPHEKTGSERGVLFIGRLRRDSNLNLLLQVISRLREKDDIPLTVHVVGAGECGGQFRDEYGEHSWIHWHGELYDEERIRDISLGCFLGCYPGNAGLSVVHMMSLSLPVITHDDLSQHGPEASFIQDGINGVFYDHAKPEESLYGAIRLLAKAPAMLAKMQLAAFAGYQDLTNPSLAARIWAIIGEGETACSESPSAVGARAPNRLQSS